MNKIKSFQILILFIIFLSMLAIIFISQQLFFSNNTQIQSYQPSTSSVKVKASQKTYYKFIALNQNLSPTANLDEPTPTALFSENQPSPTPSEEISPTLNISFESPTPTEIILAKAVSPTDNQEATSEPTLSNNQTKEVPASGFYQNLQWLFLISTLIIFFSFIL